MITDFILDKYKKWDSQLTDLIGFAQSLTTFIIYS